MAVSGIAAGPQAQQVAQSSPQHKHGRSQTPSISDVDAQNSSTASNNRSTGRVGGRVDISA
jgi:hypothetical protein